MSIQGSVNQVISSIGAAASIGKGIKLQRDKVKQELAQKQMKQQQEAKKTQRRNFMEYLKKQPISMGSTSLGTIGDLPKETQKQIASQYSKSQRKAMMDRMDKEKANGKSK